MKFSEYIDECIGREGELTVKYSNKNSMMILRDREALGTYERFFKNVCNIHYVLFEQEFMEVFFDNELDGIVVEKTMVSEELYVKYKLVISN